MGIADDEGNLVVFLEGGYDHDQLVPTSEGWCIRERVEEPTFSTRHHPVIIRPLL